MLDIGHQWPGVSERGSFGNQNMNPDTQSSGEPFDPELLQALREFVGAFEVLFHHDWAYARIMIGDEAQGRTFLNPGVEDESEDWGSRGELLEKYRKLKKLMDERGLHSIVNPHIKNFLETNGQWVP